MKQRLFPKLLLGALLSILTSCFPNPFSSMLPPVSQSGPQNPPSDINTYIHEPSVDNFYKRSTNPYTNHALSDTWDVAILNSVGPQKLLVVPVSFTNSPYYGSDGVIIQNLNKAFFGESSPTGWESVASYYHKASFGEFTLTGSVSNVIKLNYSTGYLENRNLNNVYLDRTYYVLEDVYNTFEATYLQDFDTNGDGHVDAVFFVYLAPHGNSDLFWAFQFYWNRMRNNLKPSFSVYAWASYEFMSEDSNYTATDPAAHTYIHEFGHILGLDDYYDYSNNPSSPIGGNDMMDHNIGNHNMHSKYLLNWGLPYVPTGDADIRLRPAESSGDFILINNGWNGHAYDEYILIEYYTPTGLNEKDALGPGYGARKKTQNFTIPGVKIFHVDARLVREVLHQVVWTNTIKSGGNGTDYATSNTPSRNVVSNTFRRIHLLDAKKREITWFHPSGGNADNAALFQDGDKIDFPDWQDYLFYSMRFNSGLEIGYSIEITAMSEAGVTIKLRANNLGEESA